MRQKSFTDIEYGMRKRVTKREEFLKIMDQIIPWKEWISFIEPHYPKGERGRPPVGIEKMLKMYLLQCWFNLSDEATEDAIYDSYAMRSFVGIDFSVEQAPDATTLLKFRHLLEQHGIGALFFDTINRHLIHAGVMMRGGSIVDATIISAPSLTKNADKQRDPEMHQAKKGNEWHFGMKLHVGADAGSGLIHSIETTAANVNDITVASLLLRKDDTVVYGDSGYTGLEKRVEIMKDPDFSQIDFRTNKRIGSVQSMPEGFRNYEKQMEQRKSSVRSKVEHLFLIVKRYFGYLKTVYRGLAKNKHRLYTLCTSVNLLMCARAGRFFHCT